MKDSLKIQIFTRSYDVNFDILNHTNADGVLEKTLIDYVGLRGNSLFGTKCHLALLRPLFPI